MRTMLRTTQSQSEFFSRCWSSAPFVASFLLAAMAWAALQPGWEMSGQHVVALAISVIIFAVGGALFNVIINKTLQPGLHTPLDQAPGALWPNGNYPGQEIIARAVWVDLSRLWRKSPQWKTRVETFLAAGAGEHFLHRDIHQVRAWCRDAKLVSLTAHFYWPNGQHVNPKAILTQKRLAIWETGGLVARMQEELGFSRAYAQAALLENGTVEVVLPVEAPTRRRL